MATADLTETGFDPDNVPLAPLTVTEQRANEIANLLSRGYSSPNIVRALMKQHGISRAQVYSALPRAKEILRESTEHNLQDLIAIQVGRLEHIISGRDEVVLKTDDAGKQHSHVVEGPSHRDKISAIAELSKLLGLNQPTKVAMTTPDGSASVSLTSIIMNIEENRRATVVDVASIDDAVLALPNEVAGPSSDITETEGG